jgi:dTDP-4-amino-4,6-dideoxygalactose transaminase
MSTPLIEIPCWPVFAEDERIAVERVLSSGKANYWGGQEGQLFEQEFAKWCGATYGLCVFNGTVALEIALRSVGIQPGDEVIVTPRSFLASAASVAAVGATPVFADVEFETGNISVETIKKVITSKSQGIVVVHLGGWPADMSAIMALAKQQGIKVIEDCAQAHGACIDGQKVGSFGDASAFSFCQDKIMSTGGEGGMILTSDDAVRDTAWSIRDHGRNRDQTLSNDHPPGFRWTQERIGTNGRMTEMQAAIGRCQLKKVEGWIAQRNCNAKALLEGLRGIKGIEIPMPTKQTMHSFYRLTVLFDNTTMRDSAIQILNTAGIPASIGPCPEIYKEAAFSVAGLAPRMQLTVASKLGSRSLVLPTHPGVETAIPAIIDQISQLFA